MTLEEQLQEKLEEAVAAENMAAAFAIEAAMVQLGFTVTWPQPAPPDPGE